MLCDSANHPLIDGSAMVREPAPGATLVTETFDCSRSPEDPRQAVREGEGRRDQ